MSAILSADTLNDFISPGVACIKPVETLPAQQPRAATDANGAKLNGYEVTTEDEITQTAPAPPAQITLTDCLACSGCVTSAEAVLVSLQSHEEVLSTLDAHASLDVAEAAARAGSEEGGRLFVASVSPQARASLAATYGVSERQAGHMIEQLLCGKKGVRSGGKYGSGFAWVLDTNKMRSICQAASLEEVTDTMKSIEAVPTVQDRQIKRPILASSCPGWICYAEKTHPHILPHLSRLKSPQAISGTLIKSVLTKKYGVPADRIWHLAVMPCFDKKLEASREELTDVYWKPDATEKRGVRDVDCVVTPRELLMLAESRNVSFPDLPRRPVRRLESFPEPQIGSFLFSKLGTFNEFAANPSAGSSGGYAHYIIHSLAARYPGSTVTCVRGRNIDVLEYVLRSSDGQVIAKTARYYGFRNIQNLVRKLKPAKASRLPGRRPRGANASPSNASATDSMNEYAYIEVMACPGGCTNGGGQVKVSDLPGAINGTGTVEDIEVDGGPVLGPNEAQKAGPAQQRAWLARVDEAYYSMDSSESDYTSEDDSDYDGNNDDINNGNHNKHSTEIDLSVNDCLPSSSTIQDGDPINSFLQHWSSITSIPLSSLLYTSFREVHSDVGDNASGPAADAQRVAGLAHTIGGGW